MIILTSEDILLLRWLLVDLFVDEFCKTDNAYTQMIFVYKDKQWKQHTGIYCWCVTGENRTSILQLLYIQYILGSDAAELFSTTPPVYL